MQLESLIDQLERVFSSRPYFGSSVDKILDQLPLEKANNAYSGGHSIVQILQHIFTWRKFLVEQVRGNEAYTFEIAVKDDWAPYRIESEAEWEGLKAAIRQTQQELIELLQEKTDGWLAEKPSGLPFTFEFMLLGGMQHDIYHIGQVNLLKNMESNPSAGE